MTTGVAAVAESARNAGKAEARIQIASPSRGRSATSGGPTTTGLARARRPGEPQREDATAGNDAALLVGGEVGDLAQSAFPEAGVEPRRSTVETGDEPGGDGPFRRGGAAGDFGHGAACQHRPVLRVDGDAAQADRGAADVAARADLGGLDAEIARSRRRRCRSCRRGEPSAANRITVARLLNGSGVELVGNGRDDAGDQDPALRVDGGAGEDESQPRRPRDRGHTFFRTSGRACRWRRQRAIRCCRRRRSCRLVPRPSPGGRGELKGQFVLDADVAGVRPGRGSSPCRRRRSSGRGGRPASWRLSRRRCRGPVPCCPGPASQMAAPAPRSRPAPPLLLELLSRSVLLISIRLPCVAALSAVDNSRTLGEVAVSGGTILAGWPNSDKQSL